jgi:hypothetical protein
MFEQTSDDGYLTPEREGFSGIIIRVNNTDSLPRFVNGALRTFSFNSSRLQTTRHEWRYM